MKETIGSLNKALLEKNRIIIDLEKTHVWLQEQFDRMKNCGNCKYFTIKDRRGRCGLDFNGVCGECEACDNWEVKND